MATNYYPVNPLSNPVSEWSVGDYCSTPVLLEQTEHIVYLEGTVVHARDVFTGSLAWSYDTGAPGYVAIEGVLADGLTVIISTDSEIIALKDLGETFNVNWVHQPSSWYFLGTTVGDNSVFYNYYRDSGYAGVVKLSSTGSVLFDIEVRSTYLGVGFYFNNCYYFGGGGFYNCISSGGSVIFLDRSFTQSGDSGGFVIGINDVLYGDSYYYDPNWNERHRLYKLDSGLNVFWTYNVPEPSGSLTICVYPNKVALSADYTAKIRVINSSDGTLNEEFTIPYSVSSPGIAGVIDALYVGVPEHIICYQLPGFSELFKIDGATIDEKGTFIPLLSQSYLLYGYNWNYGGIVCLKGETGVTPVSTRCTKLITSAVTEKPILVAKEVL